MPSPPAATAATPRSDPALGRPYNFALYTDYGARWLTVERNVVYRSDNTGVLRVYPPLEHVTYRDNVWDADPVGHDDLPPGVVYENNVTLPDHDDLLAATTDIHRAAGPDAAPARSSAPPSD
jgi:hypothetical protein